MSRTWLSVGALIGLFLLGPGSLGPSGQNTPGTAVDLAALFGPRGLTRDSNGDGIADRVAARVIVPASATIEDSTAAANIAARLGFETTSLSLPLVLRDSAVAGPATVELPVLVGRDNRVVRAMTARGALSLQDLRPGQGLIAAVPAPLGGGYGVVIVGGDD